MVKPPPPPPPPPKAGLREGRSVKAPLLDVECAACANSFDMRADFDQKQQKCLHCGVLLVVDRVEYLVSERAS